MTEAAPPGAVRDPVCGMWVSPKGAQHRSQYRGEVVYFCGAGCQRKFLEDPAAYLMSPRASEPSAPEAAEQGGAAYTCPMHAAVRRRDPGSCPLCGMALEPAVADASGQPQEGELRAMMRRLTWGALFAAPLVALEMGSHLGLLHVHWGEMSQRAWIEWLLATPVVLGCGWPFFARAYASAVNRSLNMFSLIALGVGSAYLYSLLATFAPGLFPRGSGAQAGPVAVYFEAAAVIVVLALLGQVLELRARAHTGSAIRALLKRAPHLARRLREGAEDEDIALDRVRVGDRLRVRPGDAVPVDGCVLEGAGVLEESMVTGESMPVEKSAGAQVIGGTVNSTGAFTMRAEKVGADMLLSRIVRMVSDAQRSRAPIQRLADVVSGWFVPAVIAAALSTFAAWMAWAPAPAFGHALIAAVSVLIIACPCALGLATPMSVMVGIGKGASVGVLIRSAEALERFERVDTLVLDKTGTLTEGRPRVVAVTAVGAFDEATVLALGASLERSSEHPLAAALVAAARARSLALQEVASFRSITGKGVTGLVAGRRVAVGNAALLADLDLAQGHLEAQAEALRRDGATAVFVAIDQRAAGVIAVADPIKATAGAALEGLRREGMRIVMLTGDDRTTALAVAAKLAIGEVRAGVSPDRKHEVVRSLKSEGCVVAMVGDGINDAPALALADVGIAMGTGTDVAMQSAGIVLLNGDLAGLRRGRALSRATMRNIRENLSLAFIYNVCGIPLAAGALYPALGVRLSPMVAAAAMSLSSVSVIGNALRLRGARI